MTRNEAIEKYIILAIKTMWNDDTCDEILEALEQPSYEPLTEKEWRIFLAAMTKEETKCMESCKYDLVEVCHRIERKVKKALWG